MKKRRLKKTTVEDERPLLELKDKRYEIKLKLRKEEKDKK